MTDKELLELAAKAAGIEEAKLRIEFNQWNPLEDDGYALRLAVKLGIVPQSKCWDEYDRLFASAYVYDEYGMEVCSVREPYTDDPYAATRRCITRAAAEIGKGMK